MSAKLPSLILNPDRVIDSLPALFDALERFAFQTNRFVRYLEEAQRGDPRQYLYHGIAEGFTAARIARRTINQLDDIIVRVRLTVQAMQAHDQRAQVMMVCVAPPALPNVATTNAPSGASIVNNEDIIDHDDYGTEQPSSYTTDFLDLVLGPDFRRQIQNYWGIISFGGDVVLSFFVIGDIIDILYNLYLGLTGQEVDELTLTFAALGLISDTGWLLPAPSAEDVPNSIFAVLKAIVKRLPKGKARDRLTDLLKQAPSDPEVANRLQAIFSKFLPRPDLIPWLYNPKVLAAILDAGEEAPKFVDLLLKHGDDAFKATDVLGKNAYDMLKQYDKIASIPGANQILKDHQILKDLGADNKTTQKAARIIKKLVDLYENGKTKQWLYNPKVLAAILDAGKEAPKFVDLLLKHGDDAFKATDALEKLEKDAYDILKQYDKIASIPGANQILKDLGAGNDTTREAARIIELTKGPIPIPKNISVQQIKELVDLYENGKIQQWSGGLKNMLSHVFKHYEEFPEFSSPKEYVDKAKELLSNPPEKARRKVRSNSDLIIWDEDSNILAIKDAQGRIRTMFRPDPKVHGKRTNEEYFDLLDGTEIKP